MCVSGTLFKLGLIGLLMQMLSRLQLTVVRSALSSIFQKAIVDGGGEVGAIFYPLLKPQYIYYLLNNLVA